MVQNFDWEIVQKYALEWLKMVENGLKHLKMVQNVSNAWKWINITEMGEMDEGTPPPRINMEELFPPSPQKIVGLML